MQLEELLTTKLGQDIWNRKYRYNGESFDEWLDRVSGKKEPLRQLIAEGKFLFGGRTLSNRNTGKKASYSNCYSSGYVPDSLSGIMEVNTNLALTYKAQGGQGLSLSKIRPKGTKINGQFESDGVIPFMKIFNQTTDSVSQGGSRKGAIMMSLDVWHKQISDFISIKTQDGSITKANLSVEIDDDFMKEVEFYYQTGITRPIQVSKKYENNLVEYTIVPIEIYKKIMQYAYDWAEPGIILTNEFRNYNLMEYIDEYEIVTGNPCGEQPLAKNGACNLGSVNLSKYVIKPYTNEASFDFNSFIKDIPIFIEAMDEVLEEGLELHALEEQKQMAKNYRNIGLGIMGVGDLFFKLGCAYGDEKSKDIFNKIMTEMFRMAVFASSDLARIKGTFLKYSSKVFESRIIKKHFSLEEIKVLKKFGLRNCSLLSIAPSGSIGTMLDISTGIEPFFAVSYDRKTESLHKEKEVSYKVYTSCVKEYLDLYPEKGLPTYLLTSGQINWKDRVDIQAIAQSHIDTAISSTINLPKTITIQEIEQLYLYAWKQKLKGITIYRNGCKRDGILSEKLEDSPPNEIFELKRGQVVKAPNKAAGITYKIKTGCGNVYLDVTHDENGLINQTFTNKGSSGSCRSNQEAVSRLISLSLRGGISIDEIIDQLKSVDICPSYVSARTAKKPVSKGASCPHAMAYILEEAKKDFQIDPSIITIVEETIEPKPFVINDRLCPECEELLQPEGGCMNCKACGFTKCE